MANQKQDIASKKKQANGEDVRHLIETGQWDRVKEQLTPTEDEVLRELAEPMVDAAEVNRLLGISDEEIANAAKLPLPESLPLRKTDA